jgi:hypothetical protein
MKAMMHHHARVFADRVRRVVAAPNAGVRHRLALPNGLD